MFRDLISSAVCDIAEHIADETVSINGHSVGAIVSNRTGESAGLSIDVSSDVSQVIILSADAERIGLAIGMDVELRDKRMFVKDFSKDDWGWTTVELS